MKLQVRIGKLPYKCGSWSNSNVTYGNNIYETFRKYVLTTKPPVLIPILSNKKLNVKNNDVVYGNEIGTYDQLRN